MADKPWIKGTPPPVFRKHYQYVVVADLRFMPYSPEGAKHLGEIGRWQHRVMHPEGSYHWQKCRPPKEMLYREAGAVSKEPIELQYERVKALEEVLDSVLYDVTKAIDAVELRKPALEWLLNAKTALEKVKDDG